MHVIAAKAVAYGEALQPEFKTYISDVVKNAKILASTLIKRGVDIVSGGTDSHLVLVDLRPKKLTGRMGGDKCTVRNLDVIKIDKDRNLMFVKGAVPGPNGGYVIIRKSRYS